MKLGVRNRTISTGEMITPLELFTPILVSDGEGGFEYEFNLTATIYGKVMPVRDTRVLENLAITFNEAFDIYIRYDSRVTSQCKLSINGKPFTIHSVENVAFLNRYFKIMCYSNG